MQQKVGDGVGESRDLRLQPKFTKIHETTGSNELTGKSSERKCGTDSETHPHQSFRSGYVCHRMSMNTFMKSYLFSASCAF